MNIFLDCGFYAGNALKIYMDKKVVDDTWQVYAFDPHPDIKVDPLPFVKFIKKAVWIKNGRVKFQVGGRQDSYSIVGTTGHSDHTRITVPCINFSKFVAELPEDAYIICSMDIEGSEYQVLEKMLKDGTASRIKILDIEFHHRFMNDCTEIESQALIDKLEAVGVKVKLKVALR